jgi:hypothetical protein
MACTTIATVGDVSGGENIRFGIDPSTMAEGTFGEYVQNLKLTAKADKQEIRGSCGTVRAVSFSKKSLDIEYTHYGIPKSGETIGSGNTMPTFAGGTALTSAGGDFFEGGSLGSVYIEEVSTEQSNSEATKTTVKAVAYQLA